MQDKKSKRILMLGWEFPPFISGGLGTACYGLTKALSQCDTEVIFVLPKAVDTEYASHVKLLSPQAAKAAHGDRSPEAVASTYKIDRTTEADTDTETKNLPGEQQHHELHHTLSTTEAFKHVTFKAVPSRMLSPYASTGTPAESESESMVSSETHGTLVHQSTTTQSVLHRGPMRQQTTQRQTTSSINHASTNGTSNGSPNYQGDLIAEAQRYANLCVDLAEGETFDVIHAHDWLTFPAGLAVAAHTGKPLVVHVHSTEFDRSGMNIHSGVYDIERRGMHGALRVIAVSHLTRAVIEHRYGINPSKIDVVYNGVEPVNHHPAAHRDAIDSPTAVQTTPSSAPNTTTVQPEKITSSDKIVLFLGRVTSQKGPEYFVQAAKKVLEKYDKVKFVIAGSGDRITDIIELAAEEGIGHKVLFTGFLKGPDVERIFKMADVYVMPSVSEPFGIAPLEAISHDVPVIISKQSGVSEVLNHALKVDFWDTREMANKIIAVLKHPPLSSTLREHADMEVRTLTWHGAAERCLQAYDCASNALAE